MKLAELLKHRSGLQNQADDLTARLLDNVKVVEGDTPPESPTALLASLDQVYAELERVVNIINRVNSTEKSPLGENLSAVLVRRELLGRRLSLRKKAAERATKRDTYQADVRYTRHVDVSTLHREADELGKQYRELDNQIQSLNWSINIET